MKKIIDISMKLGELRLMFHNKTGGLVGWCFWDSYDDKWIENWMALCLYEWAELDKEVEQWKR